MRGSICVFMLLFMPLARADGDAPLTLDEAVARALAAAPEVTAAGENAAAFGSLVDSAGRLPDPALVIGMENMPVEGADAWSATSDVMTMREIGVMQAFPNRTKRRLERERASADLDIAEAERSGTSLEVARGAALAYIRRATAESVLEDLDRLRPAAELGAAAARAGVAAGEASTADAFAAEASVARLADRILELQGEARLARADLARWIGGDADRPVVPLPAFDELPQPPERLLSDAARHGPILPYEARLEAARTDVELARAGRRPDWSLELMYSKRGPAFEDMASLEFTVDLPLFAKHRQDPAIAARGADLRKLEAEREARLREHTAQVRKALIEWGQAGARLEQFERTLLPLARDRSRAALAAYRAGNGDLRAAVDSMTDEIDLLVERADLKNARGNAWVALRYLDPEQLPR